MREAPILQSYRVCGATSSDRGPHLGWRQWTAIRPPRENVEWLQAAVARFNSGASLFRKSSRNGLRGLTQSRIAHVRTE